MLLDPSEGRFSRFGRWAFWILLFGGVALYTSDFDFNRFWISLGYALAVPCVVFALQGIIVDPILAKLRDIEYKIDRLSGRKTPWD